jgi:hypothetical protein
MIYVACQHESMENPFITYFSQNFIYAISPSSNYHSTRQSCWIQKLINGSKIRSKTDLKYIYIIISDICLFCCCAYLPRNLYPPICILKLTYQPLSLPRNYLPSFSLLSKTYLDTATVSPLKVTCMIWSIKLIILLYNKNFTFIIIQRSNICYWIRFLHFVSLLQIMVLKFLLSNI